MTDAGLWVWQLGRSMPSIHTSLGLTLSTTHTGYGGGGREVRSGKPSLALDRQTSQATTTTRATTVGT